MDKKLIVIFFNFVLFFACTKVAQAADIKINEFEIAPDQKVELYNSGNNTVDISGWFIDDDGNTQKYTIPAGTSIAPGGFKTFTSGSFNFNTSTHDTVNLLNGTDTVDSKYYASGPDSGKSFGRHPDGSDNWLIFDNPTWDASNNNANGDPIPPPSPSPTPTNAPTATPTLPPTPTPKSTVSKSPTPNGSAKPFSSYTGGDPKVLGTKEETTPSAFPNRNDPTSASPGPEFQSPLSSKVANILIGAGAVIVILSIGFYIWYKRRLETPKHEYKELKDED